MMQFQRRVWLPFLILLLVWCPVAAQELSDDRVELTVRVDPPDAEVFLLGSSSDIRNDQLRPLGRADQLLILRKSDHPGGKFSLVFRAEGYEELQRTFSPDLTTGAGIVLPAGGETLNLVPKSQTRFRVAGLLAVVSLGLGASGFFFLRGRKASKKVQDLATWLEEQKVPSEDENALIGKQLGDYWILEKLGQGGMATVYRGAKYGEPETVSYALKVIHPHLASTEDFKKRFHREALIGSKLIHPNIITVYDASEDNGNYYLVLEYVEGDSFEDRFRREESRLDAAKSYLLPLFEAVAYAHEQGVVHRDIKPENVLVRHDGVVKLSDFGLAKSHDFTKYTATGAVLGTPSYMAPEQITGREPAPAADQYALGILTFELLVGKLPFQSEELMVLLTQHLSETPPKLSDGNPALPKDLDEVVGRMLAKEPSDRYATVMHACKALRDVLEAQ
jgi:Protein kinase domain